MEYINLHLHSEYTNTSTGFPDSMIKLKDLMDFAFEHKMPGMAITDHECLSAHIPAEQYLDSKINAAETEEEKEYFNNFKLVRGNEIYLAREDMSAKSYKSGDKFYHFILLALDKEGHDQLRELSNRAWKRSFFRAIQRRYNFISDLEEVIGNNKGHVVGTTACIGGVPGTMFLNGATTEEIESFLTVFKDIFGENNFFIELAPHSVKTEDQKHFNHFMINNFKDKFNFLISTDAHYLVKKDFKIFKAFLNSKSTKEREVENFYSTAYFMDWDEIQEYCGDIDKNFLEECRLNSLKIGERCIDFRLKRTPIIPKIPIPQFDLKLKYNIDNYEFINRYINSTYLEDKYLIYKIFENYDNLINPELSLEKVLSRINLELSELWGISEALNQRMSNYLLTESKIVELIWNQADAIVGPSRGSAGSWIINYLLGITQWNPLEHPLPIEHWRFISATRPDLPR